MALKDKLAEVKSGFKKNADSESQEIMGRAEEQLRQSGILDRALKRGAKIPDFVLPTPQGEKVTSDELLAQGPLVIHFFRGAW
jgi:hypothetical protein